MSSAEATPSESAAVLTRAPGGRHLLRGDQPVFLLADTLWAAFSRMTDAEWVDALRLRRRQGFNAVNISVLPIAHDRSFGGEARAPFAVGSDGSWDLDQLDDNYFTHARQMVQVARDLGFVPVLVVLWCNYVPNTWGSARTPELALNGEQTDRYVDRVVDTFGDLQPIWCISGDDSLDDEVALARYRRALHQLKQRTPGCLTTTHSTPNATVPLDWVSDENLDVYAYQAGHDDGWEERSITLAERYASLNPQRPVFSMEPCYEGHGYGGGRGRHTARHVRRASWSGLVTGAGAGLGYAAHGAWSWHREGEQFNGESFSGMPLPGPRALELPGAWDVGLLRRIVEEHHLYDVRSRPDLVVNNCSGVCFGLSPAGDRAVAFLPEAFPLHLGVDLTEWTVETWDLSRGRRDFVAWRSADGHTFFDQPDLVEDLVYVMRR